MKLKSFQTTNYQSILDSGPVETDEITCLVGKNEAGKSALLKALYTLNPIRDEDANYDVIDDYPRVDVIDYQTQVEKGEIPPATVVTATYDLEDEDFKAVADVFGES